MKKSNSISAKTNVANTAKTSNAKSAKPAPKTTAAGKKLNTKKVAAEAADPGPVYIGRYSDKSFFVAGDTKPFATILKNANCRFNYFLSNEKGQKFAGWIMSEKRAPEVKKLFKNAVMVKDRNSDLIPVRDEKK